MLRNIYIWTVIWILTIIFGTFGVLLSPFAPNILARYIFRPWAKLILLLTGCKVEVVGSENIPTEPCIFMYNHQSVYDVISFMAVLPVEWKAIMKREIGRIPFIGWIAHLAGHYLVSRDGSASDANEVRKIVRKIKKGPSVVLAPEGTRSLDGNLLPFQEGGFLIAMMAQVPVVTMVMQGGIERRSRESKHFMPGMMKVTIFPPIDVKELPKGKAGREALMGKVRSQMESVLHEDSSK